MTRRGLGLVVVATLAIAAAEYRFVSRWEEANRPTLRLNPVVGLAPSRAFAVTQAYPAFLQRVQTAEQLADPLQRCLTSPDPPASHWPSDVVTAYCRYQMRTAITLEDASKLIAAGRAAEVDRKLAAVEATVHQQPDATGLLDNTFQRDFGLDPDQARAAIDAWKKQVPGSAFALAASGTAYVAAAFAARGTQPGNTTSEEQFAAAHPLFGLARTDLEQALAIDPRLTAAYSPAMAAENADGSVKQMISLSERGLAVDPSNYAIYLELEHAARPEWRGSYRLMRAVAMRAQRQAGANSVLQLLLPEATAAEADFRHCACKTPEQLAMMRNILDRPATAAVLSDAGNGARPTSSWQGPGEQLEASVIYLAEALRFAPWRANDRLRLVDLLEKHGEGELAAIEAQRAVAEPLHTARAVLARAWIEQNDGDLQAAETDYLQILSRNPEDRDAQARLGFVYGQGMHNWDKAWKIADALIHSHPEESAGWILRADVQQEQPRPGLADTEHYLIAHFATDPAAHDAMQRALNDVAGSGTKR